MAVKIIIDSASDITAEEAKNLGLGFIPIEIRFGVEEYLDGVNLSHAEFYNKLANNNQLPQTSQINPFRFEEEFKKATADGSEVIMITLSSKLSGTYRNAEEASKKFGGKVFVVDSLSATIGERLLGEYALKLANQNLSAKTIKTILDDAKTRLKIIAGIDTLEYLKKGGRISAVSATIGTILSIKPLIQVIDGEVKVVGKAMGTKKKNAMLTSLINSTAGIDYSMPCGIVYSGNDRSVLESFKQSITEFITPELNDNRDFSLGCTIGAHIGPGAVGISFFEK